MRPTSRTRQFRFFQPTSIGLTRLEALCLLSAGLAAVTPMDAPFDLPADPTNLAPGSGYPPRGSVVSTTRVTTALADLMADIAKAKEKYKQNIDEYRFDYLDHQNKVIMWQRDRNNLNIKVNEFNDKISEYNNTYRPRSLSLKVKPGIEPDPTTGKPTLKLELEYDISNIFVRRQQAQEDLDKILQTTSELNSGKLDLNRRWSELTVEQKKLAERKKKLDADKERIENMEQAAGQKAREQGTSVTFDNSDLQTPRIRSITS